MRFVAARKAEQEFACIFEQAESGQAVIITRHGQPVATLRVYTASGAAERELAIEQIVNLMRNGIPVGGPFARNEMHQRERSAQKRTSGE